MGNIFQTVENGVRIGPTDAPQDLINSAVPLPLDTPIEVTIDAGDWDFFTFTLDAQTTSIISFTDFTGTLTGLDYSFYHGEGDIPAGGWSGTQVSTPDRTIEQSLDPDTYYLAIHVPGGCTEAGTFVLTRSMP